MFIPFRQRLGLMFLCVSFAPELLNTTHLEAQDGDDVVTNSIGMKLKWIPSGKFMMGPEQDQREVTLTQDFHLSVFEVTQEQYEKVMGTNPSWFFGVDRFSGDVRNPVESVSWQDADEFCRRLSELPEEQTAGRVYRLPTEAEWEYACRAGTTTKYGFGDDESLLRDYGWVAGSAGGQVHVAGEKKPNQWGLHDMHGNVWEWVQDWYADYPRENVTDPTGPETGTARVLRGGSFEDVALECQSSFRRRYVPTFTSRRIGFRVAFDSLDE